MHPKLASSCAVWRYWTLEATRSLCLSWYMALLTANGSLRGYSRHVLQAPSGDTMVLFGCYWCMEQIWVHMEDSMELLCRCHHHKAITESFRYCGRWEKRWPWGEHYEDALQAVLFAGNDTVNCLLLDQATYLNAWGTVYDSLKARSLHAMDAVRAESERERMGRRL